jgi:hypothetical protein
MSQTEFHTGRLYPVRSTGTLDKEAGYRHFVVAFTDATHLSNIAHKIVHLKNAIYLACAMEVDRYNDEPEAYLTGWLFDQINNFLNK